MSGNINNSVRQYFLKRVVEKKWKKRELKSKSFHSFKRRYYIKQEREWEREENEERAEKEELIQKEKSVETDINIIEGRRERKKMQ